MKAILIASRFSTHLLPLNIYLPIPMVPLVNRPIMLHIIEWLKRHGIAELILLLYHQHSVIRDYFGDGSEFGIKITYVNPVEEHGTAGAVKAAAKHFDERIIIINANLLTDLDISKATSFHEEKKAKATIILTSVQNPLQFRMVITDNTGRITNLPEKPVWGEAISDTINTGIYILEPEVLDYIPDGVSQDWDADIFPKMLIAEESLYGCVLEGFWTDLVTTDAYIESVLDIFSHKIEVRIGIAPIRRQGQELYIGRGCTIAGKDYSGLEGMVVIGNNTDIRKGSRIKNCVIGRNCTIEEGVELEDTILWDNVHIKKKSSIKGAVLCHNILVGQGVLIKEEVVVGDETRIGDASYLKKGVKVWPGKHINNGSTIATSLIWGEKRPKSILESATVRGLTSVTNVKLTPKLSIKQDGAYESTRSNDSTISTWRDTTRALVKSWWRAGKR